MKPKTTLMQIFYVFLEETRIEEKNVCSATGKFNLQYDARTFLFRDHAEEYLLKKLLQRRQSLQAQLGKLERAIKLVDTQIQSLKRDV